METTDIAICIGIRIDPKSLHCFFLLNKFFALFSKNDEFWRLYVYHNSPLARYFPVSSSAQPYKSYFIEKFYGNNCCVLLPDKKTIRHTQCRVKTLISLLGSCLMIKADGSLLAKPFSGPLNGLVAIPSVFHQIFKITPQTEYPYQFILGQSMAGTNDVFLLSTNDISLLPFNSLDFSVVDLAASSRLVCYLSETNELYYQIFRHNAVKPSLPTLKVTVPSDQTVVCLASSAHSILFSTNQNKLYEFDTLSETLQILPHPGQSMEDSSCLTSILQLEGLAIHEAIPTYLLLLEDGRLFGKGSNDYGQLALPEPGIKKNFEFVRDKIRSVCQGFWTTTFIDYNYEVYMSSLSPFFDDLTLLSPKKLGIRATSVAVDHSNDVIYFVPVYGDETKDKIETVEEDEGEKEGEREGEKENEFEREGEKEDSEEAEEVAEEADLHESGNKELLEAMRKSCEKKKKTPLPPADDDDDDDREEQIVKRRRII